MTPFELLSAIESTGEDGERPLAIYVHIPFCASKCHFCDWVTDVPVARLRSGAATRSAYVDALCRQIRGYGPLLTDAGYRPAVMYWGGGTPTRLDPDEMRAIADALYESFDLTTLRQWSVETTPNDLTATKVAAMRDLGVTRVSVGVQSFSPAQLRRSGRAHTGADSVRAVGLLREHGIDNFNLDLICGFPGEPAPAFEASLDEALDLDPPHISVYPYRPTPGTIMAMQIDRATVGAHTAGPMIRIYERAMSMLRTHGYGEYCHGYWVRRPEDEDLDGNFKYDLTGDKIGFGSGAESIIAHHLLWNENSEYPRYLADPLGFSVSHRFDTAHPEHLTAPIGGALMTREGVVRQRFHQLTGLDLDDVRATGYVQRWLALLHDFGGRFVDDGHSLRLDPATIHTAYIGHLAATAGLHIGRA
ncbi:radical SAM protein [Micromonospora sp. NPDC051296]|uniref:coproporphyrinogen-III oxidase family protein n=1 Tax=Micromonospora sp. NPDC051296 TaxID=3155046 RepID=UPI0034217CDB